MITIDNDCMWMNEWMWLVVVVVVAEDVGDCRRLHDNTGDNTR